MSLKQVSDNLLKYSFLLALFIVTLATVSYFLWDQNLSLYFNNEDLMPHRKFGKLLTDIGLGANSFAVAFLSFVVFYSCDKKLKRRNWQSKEWPWLKSWSLNYFFALIFSGFILNLAKFFIGRQRPHVSATFESQIFVPMNLDSYFQSMPSGHSQVVFTSATMFAILWPRASVFIYLLAGLLAFTRVVVHAHFLSDILIGSLIGHLGTLCCLWLFQRYSPNKYSLSSRLS